MAGQRRPAEREDGFTLVEMVVSIGIAAFVFVSLAAVMTASLRTLAVQKGRTRANEIATQAIEDLQRYDFNSLGTCAASRAPSPPAGLTDSVGLGSCPATVTAAFGDPCGAAPAATGNALIPKGVYTCHRPGIDAVRYAVRRYIAWADAAHTTKRLAVFVDWTDQAGGHQVSQQSSLRAPDQGADIGLGPPGLTNPLVTVVSGTSDNSADLSGDPGQLLPGEQIQLQVDSINNSTLATADKVFAAFRTLDTTNANAPQQSTMFLTPNAAGTRWTGTITNGAGYTFGAGTQVFTFGIVRDTDGKSNSTIAPTAVRFCPAGGCNSSTLPNLMSLSPGQPVAVDLAPGAGLLEDDVDLSIQTHHVTAQDSVMLTFPTRSGAVSILFDSNNSCVLNGSTTQCTWSGTVPASAGYMFDSTSPQQWYLTASQVVDLTNSEDRGSTLVFPFSVSMT